MNVYLRAVAESQGGVFLRPQALSAGYSSDDIQELLRRGTWVAVRRGAYVERAAHEAQDRDARHRSLVHAVGRQLTEPAVISHTSAAVVHGLPTWGLDLEHVHVSRTDLKSARREAGVHHHCGELRDEDVTTVGGLKVTSLARTVIDTARICEFEPALCVADAAFHLVPESRQQALERLDDMRDWRGANNAGSVISFADGKSEGVGETRSRLIFHRTGLPEPALQQDIYASAGFLIGRADFLWEKFRTIAEFDGKIKYGSYLRPGEQPSDVVWREKKREDELRRLGYEVVRIIWADLDKPLLIVRRIRDAFDRGRRNLASA